MTMNEQSPQRPVVAIRVIMRDNQGNILLLKRANSQYGDGRWCLPGGKLDYGDTPENTVAKEIKEETDLDVREVSFLFYQNSLPPEPGKMHCLNLYFACGYDGTVKLNEESGEHRWLRPEEALKLKPVFGAVEAIERWVKS